MKRPIPHLVTALALVLLAALVYGLGWGNALVFDDDRLIDGTVYGHYGGLWPLKQRLLSRRRLLLLRQWSRQRLKSAKSTSIPPGRRCCRR